MICMFGLLQSIICTINLYKFINIEEGGSVGFAFVLSIMIISASMTTILASLKSMFIVLDLSMGF